MYLGPVAVSVAVLSPPTPELMDACVILDGMACLPFLAIAFVVLGLLPL